MQIDKNSAGKSLSEDRRLFERFKAKVPVRFIEFYRKTQGEGYTYDVSAKGLGLVTKIELKPLSSIEIWLDIPDNAQPLYTRGEVIWSKRIDEENFKVGVELERADLMGMGRILRLFKTYG